MPYNVLFLRNIVETDPSLLVTLLAVRTLGGQQVPVSSEVITCLKKPIKEAIERGWLKEGQCTETVVVDGNKPRAKKVTVLELPEEGDRVRRQAADPEALAATQASEL